MLRWFCSAGDALSVSHTLDSSPEGGAFCICRFAAMTERVYSPKTPMKKYTQIA